MASAREILLGIARKHALAYKDAEKRGDLEAAISNLRRTIEALEEYARLYPDDVFSRRALELVRQYRRRLKLLERRAAQAVANELEVEVNDSSKEDYGNAVDERDLPPEFALKEKPNVTFNDIAGLDDAKRAIKEAIVYPIRRPDLFPLGWPRGILLFGPPGTGKTMLAAAVANEIDGEFLYVDAASIMSKWLGEAEKNVKKLFTYARNRAKKGVPVIIFIDEVDALLGVHVNEVGGEVRVRNQFLKEMDGIQDKSEKLHVYVIAATNKPWKLDEPFIRRFQKRIYVPLPDKAARKRLLEILTKNIRLASDVDLDKLADMLDGYSGSDIRDIVQSAYMRTVREFFERSGGQGEPRPVSMRDFMEVLKTRKPSVSPEMIKVYEEWYEKFKAL
ncbi:MAG: AAA family ATPase [Desulfurococcales archaeon]|nr:AAA family ATPase [Desulfurococcales archaeon]